MSFSYTASIVDGQSMSKQISDTFMLWKDVFVWLWALTWYINETRAALD